MKSVALKICATLLEIKPIVTYLFLPELFDVVVDLLEPVLELELDDLPTDDLLLLDELLLELVDAGLLVVAAGLLVVVGLVVVAGLLVVDSGRLTLVDEPEERLPDD